MSILHRLAAVCAPFLLFASLGATAQEAPVLSKGQNLYLPIYSHIWHGNPGRSGKPDMAQLSALVSIRNIDSLKPLRIHSAKYYDTDGKLLREFLPAVKVVPPLGTLELLIDRKESDGGSGANFIIRWSSDEPMAAPLVQAVHADLYGLKPITFVTEALPTR